MLQLNEDSIYQQLYYADFIPFMKRVFKQDVTAPQRLHRDYGNGIGKTDSTLLVMPAWQDGKYLGIKTVTVSPYNRDLELPTIQGVYLLFNAGNGTQVAQFDAASLTACRTAAKSALAASYLARKNSEIMLMVGTGALSTELIRAHRAVHPIKKVYIWEHTKGKGHKVIEKLDEMGLEFEVTDDLSLTVPEADIISVATLSSKPLILGKWLQPGQHLDMVGAYRKDMREADDEVLHRSTLFIDHHGAYEETGDLAIPLEKGVIRKEDVKATLFELCRDSKPGRKSEDEITFFKSTGHAIEDYSAAIYLYDQVSGEKV